MKEACGCADGRQAELHSKLVSATHREEYRRLASRGNVKKRENVSEKAYARLVFPCVSCIYVKTKHVQISWETEIRSKMLKKTARRPKRGALLSLSGCVYFPKGTVWNAREDKKLHVALAFDISPNCLPCYKFICAPRVDVRCMQHS